VSTKRQSILFFFENSIALKATDAGSEPVSDLIILAPIFSDQISSCSIAAALNVSAAAKTICLLSLENILPSFPIVVVFPTPLTPAINITAGFILSSITIYFSSGNINFLI